MPSAEQGATTLRELRPRRADGEHPRRSEPSPLQRPQTTEATSIRAPSERVVGAPPLPPLRDHPSRRRRRRCARLHHPLKDVPRPLRGIGRPDVPVAGRRRSSRRLPVLDAPINQYGSLGINEAVNAVDFRLRPVRQQGEVARYKVGRPSPGLVPTERPATTHEVSRRGLRVLRLCAPFGRTGPMSA